MLIIPTWCHNKVINGEIVIDDRQTMLGDPSGGRRNSPIVSPDLPTLDQAVKRADGRERRIRRPEQTTNGPSVG